MKAQRFEGVETPDGTWFAPGRINIIGEHTDYNDGFVLPAALAQGATAQVRLRNDDLLRLHAVDLNESCEVRLSEVSPGAGLGWAAYVAGVGWAASQRGLPVPGIDLAVTSNVPVGAGLSSSAALSCVTAQAWNDLAGWGLDGPEIAALGRDAENHIAGAPTGLMDQLASVCGRVGHVLQIDTRTGEIRPVPLDLDRAGLAILVIDSNTPHTHADGEYAERRASCQAAAEALGVPALRDVPIDDVASSLADLPDVLRRRARHVITDSARVKQVSQLLAGGADPRRIGPLLNASHESMRHDFEITAPTVDLLQETAVSAGAYGARMTGGGFGGCVIALVDAGDVDAIVNACAAAAAAAHHPKPASFIAQIGDGAHRIDR
ncbi:galactokinase [Demetria terragena]|uniref:galactokinase n=1 Tax=Demetria terragena TaxID=63959 RepID=UPI00036017BC|nr:galactokinase [Demetria terragena]